MQTETYVRLEILSSARTPEAITTDVGLACNKSWKIGDTRKHTIIVEETNGWILNSGCQTSDPLDVHLRSLWHILSPAKDNIRRLSSTDVVEIACAIYAPRPPALYFEPDIIKHISELGAGLDIDLYILE